MEHQLLEPSPVPAGAERAGRPSKNHQGNWSGAQIPGPGTGASGPVGLKRPGNRNVPKASEETELEPHPAAPATAYWPAWRGQEGSGQCPSQWEQGGGRRGQREGRCLGSPSLGSSGQRPHVAAGGAAPSLGTSQPGRLSSELSIVSVLSPHPGPQSGQPGIPASLLSSQHPRPSQWPAGDC